MQNIKKHISNELKELYSPGEIRTITSMILERELNISRIDILNCKFSQLSGEAAGKVEKIIDRLKKSEPIQYVFEEADFYDMKFKVNSDVLIPRPETEELVEWVLKSIGKNPLKILDIGTGSGCIAVTIAKKAPQTEVHAWDISNGALRTARENAQLHGVEVTFSQKDILTEQSCSTQFDVIISNPPYICESERAEMENNVLNHEPHLALFVPDEEPLIFYDRISDFAIANLHRGGLLFFEINRAGGDAIERMLQEKGFGNIELRKDMSGNNRMIQAERI